MANTVVNPTRMELTRLKGKLKTAQRGHKLLKDKRDELMKQFLDTVRELRSLRSQVEEELMRVHSSFTVASALMSAQAMEQALMYPKQSVELTMTFLNVITYSTDKNIPANLVTISAGRAFEIIAMNKAGEKPLQLQPDGTPDKNEKKYNDILDQNNLNRFDNKKKKKRRSGQGGGNPDKVGGDNKPRNNDRQGGGERQERKPRPDRQQPRRQEGQRPEGGERKGQQGQRPRRDNNRQPQQGNDQQSTQRPDKPSQPEQ